MQIDERQLFFRSITRPGPDIGKPQPHHKIPQTKAPTLFISIISCFSSHVLNW
jgi:hypothetical protein